MPMLLVLLALVPLLWIAARAGSGTTPSRSLWRQRGSLCARTCLCVALTFALAGAQLAVPVHNLTVIFLLDRSDSVAPAQRRWAEEYVQQALASLPAGDRAGIVIFGEQALVGRLPSDERTLESLDALPGGAHTNIAEAIKLALGLLPERGQRRLVLLSDGGANIGDSQAGARIAAARGVPLEVVRLGAANQGPDIQISDVRSPSAVHKGQRVELAVTLDSTTTSRAQITVADNGRPVLSQPVQLAPG